MASVFTASVWQRPDGPSTRAGYVGHSPQREGVRNRPALEVEPLLVPCGLDLGPALELVERHRGVADTIRRADVHVSRASAAIAPFPDGRAKSDLIAAVQFAVGRDR